jgi:endonuclease/exonuclease/phosphatase family metal-dependent hydrolase
MTPSFDRELREAGLRRRLPNAIVSLRTGASGAAIYSRLPLRELAEDPVHPFRQSRAELTLPEGSHVRLVDVHPYPPGRGNVDIWEEALESLPTTAAGVPWVLAGDFNATLDQSELRDVIDGGYRDAGEVAGEGLEPTWPAGAWARRLPGVTIDHVLADRRLGIADYAVADLSGSDHRAVWALLVLP